MFYNFIWFNIEIPKDFIFVIFLKWLWFVCVALVTALWYFIQSNQWTLVPTLAWHFLYWLLAKIEHALTMCVILSVFSLQSLHSGVLLVLSIKYLITLTCRACSWAACKRLSVSRLSCPHFIHSHLFLSSVLSVSLKNRTWRAFSFHSIRRCFLLSCLF